MAVLYVVGTPIGNLEDMTLRALRILKEVDLIACEDTRVTKKLLVHYQINKPLVSYHQHSQISKINFLIQELMVGKKVALVTDAGMPGISDPGSLLVKAAVQENIKVEVIPGPSAATAALSVSGLPVDRFLFLGFLPHKKGRETMIKEIIASEQSVIFYESVHRILKTLGQLKQFGLKREFAVCRELTKKFESIYRGTVEEVLEQLLKDRVKGEFVVIVSNK